MKNNTVYTLSLFMIILIMVIGGVYNTINPITEGEYREYTTTKFLAVGDFAVIEVLEEKETNKIMNEVDVVVVALSNNQTKQVRNSDFIQDTNNGIEIKFVIYYWDYSVETILYDINKNSIVEIDVLNVTITVTTNYIETVLIGPEQLTIERNLKVMGIVVLISGFILITMILRWVNTESRKQLEDSCY